MQLLRVFTVCLFSAFCCGQIATAGDSPVQKLQAMNDEALEIVYGEAFTAASAEEKQAKILEVMENSFDLSVIVKRAMGANWKLLTEAEQVTVVDLVKRIAVRALYRALQGAERPQFEYGKLVQQNSKRAELPVSIRTGETVVYVDFRFGRMESGWQIFDIVAEKVSFVSNYRQQINDHFRKKDAQALIAKLEDILNNATTDDDIKL